jgi:long-chain acyl-CoA synthetase
MIISGGVNLYPQEIEAALREAPGVWDVRRRRRGRRTLRRTAGGLRRACSVRVDANPDALLAAALQAHCEANLGRFKRPAVFHVLAELPRSPTGKLLRRKLREHLAH